MSTAASNEPTAAPESLHDAGDAAASIRPSSESRVEPPSQPERQGLSFWILIGLVAVSVLALLAAEPVTRAARPELLLDPGPWVRWLAVFLPLTQSWSMALTLGSLALVTLIGVPSSTKLDERWGMLVLVPAMVWLAVAAARLVVVFAPNVSSFSDPNFGAALWQFAVSVELGQSLSYGIAVPAIVAAGAALMQTRGQAMVLLVVAASGLIPMALAGHSGGNNDHETAVSALGFHLGAVLVWVGALTVLVMTWNWMDRAQRAVTVQRFSQLAAFSLLFAVLFGVLSAQVRVGDWSGLFGSEYGTLVLVKTALTLLVIAVACQVRSYALLRMQRGDEVPLWNLVRIELLVMAALLGVSATLGRSAPPVSKLLLGDITPVENLTGFEMPPYPTLTSVWGVWRIDIFWVLIGVVAIAAYLRGVWLLKQRGDSWPMGRTVAWLVGWALMLFLTSGPLMVYGRVLFSGHMLLHMSVSMFAGPLLALAAPVTLMLRVSAARKDETWGVREWVRWSMELRYLRILTFPPVAAGIFVGSLLLFYYTPLFEISLRTHVGHELMHLHFLFAGYLFAWVLVGVDPAPTRSSYPIRLVSLLATMAFHAFMGVSMMMGTEVLGRAYFEELQRPYMTDLLADQNLGGSIAWGIGELPTLMLAIALAVQWSRSDDRQNRRRDRAADRDGDAELEAYNAMLARAASRGRSALED